MPSSEFWSAAMVLRWVMTRDLGAVLGMLHDYGSFEPRLGGRLVRTPAETWKSVSAAYSKLDSGLREKVSQSEDAVNHWKDEIYAVLLSGKLRSWVLRNERGDLVPAEPAEWIRRRFFSLYGHDLAVPLFGEGGASDWGRHFDIAETLCGDAPLPVPSTVWMNPVFSAEDAQNLWPRVFKSEEDRFVKWMKAQKEQSGRYPPRSRTPGSDRPGFEEWARKVGIGRVLVRRWVKKHGLSHRQGAPGKKLQKK